MNPVVSSVLNLSVTVRCTEKLNDTDQSMHIHRILIIAGAAAAISACASSRQAADRADPTLAQASPSAQSVQWTATLGPQSGTNVAGTATVSSGDNAAQTRASVNLTGADSGAVHPWHVHSGRCGDNGPIVGPASAYPPLTVAGDGTATVTATLPFATPMSGSYYVNVHRSATEMGTIVSCGNLSVGGS